MEVISDSVDIVEEEEETVVQVFIIGAVDQDIDKDIIKALLSIDFNNVAKMRIYVCSEGGFVRDCFSLIDVIDDIRSKYSELKIETVGLGEVASSGFWLFLLGDKRTLMPHCTVFVHEHIVSVENITAKKLKMTTTSQRRLYDSYITWTSERLGISKKQSKNLFKQDKFLSSKEIDSYNITTKES